MRLFKKISVAALAIGIVSSMSGCVYAHNQSWDDMSYDEQQEIKQTFSEIKEDLEYEFSDDTIESAFVLRILGAVEEGISYQE